MVEIIFRNWLAIFCEERTFCRLLFAVPLKVYSKFGQPKWILIEICQKMANGQLLFPPLEFYLNHCSLPTKDVVL